MKLLVANWKLYPASPTEAKTLARSIANAGRLKKTRVVLCPPFPFLEQVSRFKNKSTFLGAQDVFWELEGAFTGEVSAMMLRTLHVSHVIIGHSERRHVLHETDEMIAKKVCAAREAGLTVILCVGEKASIRKRGMIAVKKFIDYQLRSALSLTPRRLLAKGLVVAYEPVWAIGRGKPNTPQSSAEMARHVKKMLRMSYKLRSAVVLYGGSVTSKNVRSFVQYKDIDGALVGGASVKREEFRRIVTIVDKIK